MLVKGFFSKGLQVRWEGEHTLQQANMLTRAEGQTEDQRWQTRRNLSAF